MKETILSFEIGKDYELWEFDLEITNYERLPYYDSYLYLGEVKKFLNYISDRTELIFYWDRLEAVFLTFLNMNMNDFEEIKIKLKTHFELVSLEEYPNHTIIQYDLRELSVYLIWKYPNTTYILYGNSVSLEEQYRNVLIEISE